MNEMSATNDVAVPSPQARPFADPARFAAISARIDTEIMALSRDRLSLARARRQFCIVGAVYALGVFCIQGALRATLTTSKVRRPLTTAGPEVASPLELYRIALLTNRSLMPHLPLGLVGARSPARSGRF